LQKSGRAVGNEALKAWQTAADSMPHGFRFLEKPNFLDDGWSQQGFLPGAIVPNPFFLLKNAKSSNPIYQKQEIQLKDAGIDFNLPFPPLLRPERNINVIIAWDASGDILQAGAASLSKAYKYAQKHGLKFPTITSKVFKKASKQNLTVIGNPSDPRELTIIYMPLIKNSKLEGELGEYEPAAQSYTGTFNFVYKKPESSMLIKYAEENVKAHKDIIIDTITKKAIAMNGLE
jgi:hypothetical protein